MNCRARSPYAPLLRLIQRRHRIRVRRWRRAMSGCAWQTYHASGDTVQWVEAPLPRTPLSLAIFLHEVGHHVIGFDRYRLSCQEEYHAWTWALMQMKRLGVPPDARTLRRFEASMEYAVDKAVRRGVARLPRPLMRFSPVNPPRAAFPEPAPATE